MTDTVVISGRISKELMHQLKKLNKSNTQILNEALKQYISKYTTEKQCIQSVYSNQDNNEYNLLCQTLDSLPKRYKDFVKESDEK